MNEAKPPWRMAVDGKGREEILQSLHCRGGRRVLVAQPLEQLDEGRCRERCTRQPIQGRRRGLRCVGPQPEQAVGKIVVTMG